LSLSWTTGKIITITPTADRITIQWCILSESLNFAGHGYASLAGGKRVSWHHNLLAHNYSRNVRLQGAVDAVFRNNVVYDWGDAAGYGEFDRLNYVGNLLKPGPSTTQKTRLFMLGDHVVLPGSIFVEGNVLSQQNDNVPFEQSRNVPLTTSSSEDARRTTTHDASRSRPAGDA